MGSGQGASGTRGIVGPTGRALSYEPIAEYATAELGYNLELERTRARFDGADELTPIALRATNIFRREDGAWRIVQAKHRVGKLRPWPGVLDAQLGLLHHLLEGGADEVGELGAL